MNFLLNPHKALSPNPNAYVSAYASTPCEGYNSFTVDLFLRFLLKSDENIFCHTHDPSGQ